MDALIGYTGFVGGTIASARPFQSYFRSSDIESIRGHQFDLVVCCGAPAEKWRANKDPIADRNNIQRLTRALAEVAAGEIVLVSTVDVYPAPTDVDENTAIELGACHAYGRHRFELEQFCAERFPTTIVRLPALYGPGLKKNALYDLLHNNQVDKIDPRSRFQFYDVRRLWKDIEVIRSASIRLANITAAPVAMAEIAATAFGRVLSDRFAGAPPSYDVRSRHAALVGGRSGYWFDRDNVLHGVVNFVRETSGK